MSTRSKRQGKKRQKAAEEKAPSLNLPLPAIDSARSPTPPPPALPRAVSMSATPNLKAAAVDEMLEAVSDPSRASDSSGTLPTVGKGKGRGKKSKEKAADQQQKRKPRQNFILSPEQLPRNVDPGAANVASEAGSDAESAFSVETNRDEELETEGLLSNIEKTTSQASIGSVYGRGGTSRSSKMKRKDAEEDDCLREIRNSMKANTQLLAQLVGEKTSSPRDPFITYVSDTLRRLPDHQYNAVMRKILSLLQNLNTTDSSAETPPPPQLHSTCNTKSETVQVCTSSGPVPAISTVPTATGACLPPVPAATAVLATTVFCLPPVPASAVFCTRGQMEQGYCHLETRLQVRSGVGCFFLSLRVSRHTNSSNMAGAFS